MLRETSDPATINAIANHPDVLPGVSPLGGAVDLSSAVHDGNVFLFGEHGGICWGWTGPGVFEGHVMLTKAGRGAWGIRAGRWAIEEMARRGARLLWCRVHPDRPEVARYVTACGMHDTGDTNICDIGTGPVRWRLYERSI